ncbi:aldose epimerase family protein [Celeribacter sp.]|uniref:aldose epimerase family protein n=1 Tax=Celeribacter sp. TaxID=1890673 RepID=UPI003A924AD6
MRRPFGTTADGRKVEAASLHAGELSVTILTLGAIVNDVRLKGVAYPLTLGSDDLAAYDAGPLQYYGALVGPVANRIAGASVPLNGATLNLTANEGTTCLHGGPDGMHREIWDIESHTESALTLTLTLPDGKGGFPGVRSLRARFSVDAPAHLRLVIEAETDKDTYINIANHSYWSLDGHATITGHTLTAPADRYTPVDAALIPTGVAPVADTGFDFRRGRALGENTPRIDHNLCLSDAPVPSLQHACTLSGTSGLTLRIDTTEPGLQVYDAGRNSSAPFVGLNGKPYGAFSGAALEPQRWPDGPNQTGFPSCLLKAGESYRQETVWSFSKA